MKGHCDMKLGKAVFLDNAWLLGTEESQKKDMGVPTFWFWASILQEKAKKEGKEFFFRVFSLVTLTYLRGLWSPKSTLPLLNTRDWEGRSLGLSEVSWESPVPWLPPSAPLLLAAPLTLSSCKPSACSPYGQCQMFELLDVLGGLGNTELWGLGVLNRQSF